MTSHSRPSKKPTLWAFAFLFIFSLNGRSNDCSDLLKQALDHYGMGRFEKVITMLEDCLSGTAFSFDEQKAAYILRARSWLGLDNYEQASLDIDQLLRLEPNFQPGLFDASRFKKMVEEVRGGKSVLMVSTVSRTPESLREAPATVSVITAEEMGQRGYLSLVDLFNDLPAFDITLGNSSRYANLYQRGYRSQGNDRTLFMINGVEDNDIWSNGAYLSRQYALSNVERVEVIYGPASTMYGANAFLGVINVITKTPESLAHGVKPAVRAVLGAGSWNTRFTDVTMAGTAFSRVHYSLNARLYQSNEMDRSHLPEWDFNPSFYDSYNYYNRLGLTPGNAYHDTLVDRARELDKAALEHQLQGRDVAYSDNTNDWSIDAAFTVSNFMVGYQMWYREEGNNSWYTDNDRSGADNGNAWIPKHSTLYVKYDRNINRKLDITVFSRFKHHRFDGDTRFTRLNNYSNGRLKLANLEKGETPFWQTTRFQESSNQFKTDLTLAWRPKPNLSIVSGLEARSSLIQGDYRLKIYNLDSNGQLIQDENGNPLGLNEVTNNRHNRTPTFYDQVDLGLFAQASYKYKPTWKFVLGGRVDHNRVRQSGGYGSVFNPRLAVVHSPGDFVFKLVYAEAFKDASNFNRYSTVPGLRDIPNPDLEPERVKNIEISADWKINEILNLDLSYYDASYNNAVELRNRQNQAIGELEIQGIQANLRMNLSRYDLYANYTYTDPLNLGLEDEDTDPVRVDDIASHQINLGLNARPWKKWNFNLRANWVGDRKHQTRIDASGHPFDHVDAFFLANFTAIYKDILPGADLRLLINNLLDNTYDHPGVRSAKGAFASRQPQNKRAFFLSVNYSF